MIFCSDPALTLLKDEGYNVIRLPRAGIRPLDVLSGTGGRLEHLGALRKVWNSNAKEPKPYDPRPTGTIKAGSSQAIKASLGISILKDLLSGFGVSSPKVKTAFKRARTLTFSYDTPKQWGIEPFHIGEYLEKGDLIPNRMLEKHMRDSRLYLISELLLSSTLSVTAEAKTSGSAAVDVGLLKNVVKAKAELGIDLGDHTSITFKGKKDIAFGFKAFELTFRNGTWSIGDFADPGSVSFGTDQAADPPPHKFDESLVNLR